LQPPSAGLAGALTYEPPRLPRVDDFASLVRGKAKATLEAILPAYLVHSAWFAGKEKKPKAARIIETIPLEESANPCISIIEVEYDETESDRYALPLGFYVGKVAYEARERTPKQVVAKITIAGKSGEVDGLVCDAMADPRFGRLLFEVFERRRRV